MCDLLIPIKPKPLQVLLLADSDVVTGPCRVDIFDSIQEGTALRAHR